MYKKTITFAVGKTTFSANNANIVTKREYSVSV
jgi:hypothetical protein